MAVAVVYHPTNYPNAGGNYIELSYPLKMYGLDQATYQLTEVFDGQNLGLFKPISILTYKINPSGIFMFTAKPV